jgi:hypothetical protein
MARIRRDPKSVPSQKEFPRHLLNIGAGPALNTKRIAIRSRSTTLKRDLLSSMTSNASLRDRRWRHGHRYRRRSRRKSHRWLPCPARTLGNFIDNAERMAVSDDCTEE